MKSSSRFYKEFTIAQSIFVRRLTAACTTCLIVRWTQDGRLHTRHHSAPNRMKDTLDSECLWNNCGFRWELREASWQPEGTVSVKVAKRQMNGLMWCMRATVLISKHRNMYKNVSPHNAYIVAEYHLRSVMFRSNPQTRRLTDSTASIACCRSVTEYC